MDVVTLYLVDARDKTLEGSEVFHYVNRQELKSLSKYRVDAVRKEKILSLYLKKKYIGHYTLDEHEKPLCEDKYFNVSHSHGVIVLAISNNAPVGVDVEIIKKSEDDLRKYVSSEEEYKYIKEDKNFFEIWTSKESLLKCVGTGINQSLNSVPAFPLEGIKEFDKEFYFSKMKYINDYVISVTLKGKDDFEIKIIEEVI